jgi:hypothetical protein
MANAKRLAQKEKKAVLVWLKIYLIRLLPFPVAESTAQRFENSHRHIPVRQRLPPRFCYHRDWRSSSDRWPTKSAMMGEVPDAIGHKQEYDE